MSDRLALAHAIEDAGIPRDKAEGVATAIAHFVEGGVATKAELDAAKAELKADIQATRADLKAEITTVRSEMRDGFADLDGKIGRQDVAIERLRSSLRELESRLTVRLGGLMVVLTGVVLAALRHWLPH